MSLIVTIIWLVAMLYAGLRYGIVKWLRGINEVLEEVIRLQKNIDTIKGLKKKNHPGKGGNSTKL